MHDCKREKVDSDMWRPVSTSVSVALSMSPWNLLWHAQSTMLSNTLWVSPLYSILVFRGSSYPVTLPVPHGGLCEPVRNWSRFKSAFIFKGKWLLVPHYVSSTLSFRVDKATQVYMLISFQRNTSPPPQASKASFWLLYGFSNSYLFFTSQIS